MSGAGGLQMSVRLARRDFLMEIELELEPGERLALVGPSGAGKTSILKLVAGLIPPDTGTIRIADRTVFDSHGRIDLPPESRNCGYVPQDYSLFPHLTALENVGFGILNVKAAERRRRSGELLEQLGIGALADVNPSGLSGGEQQRVALARALATEPKAFLLDEPLSALDPATRDQALPVLEEVLVKAGVPALIVTHSRQEAQRLADSTVIIERGQVSGTRGNHPAGRQVGSQVPGVLNRVIRKQRD